MSDSTLAYLKDAVWVEKPARLFQNLVVESVRARGNRLVVREGDLGYNAITQLSGQLLDMGYDVASGSTAAAVGSAESRKIATIPSECVHMNAAIAAI